MWRSLQCNSVTIDETILRSGLRGHLQVCPIFSKGFHVFGGP
ncbi:hypothetical protein V6Z11_A02G076700 [Gossypium hirsutum]